MPSIMAGGRIVWIVFQRVSASYGQSFHCEQPTNTLQFSSIFPHLQPRLAELTLAVVLLVLVRKALPQLLLLLALERGRVVFGRDSVGVLSRRALRFRRERPRRWAIPKAKTT